MRRWSENVLVVQRLVLQSSKLMMSVRFRPRAPSNLSVSSNGRTAVSKTAYQGSNPWAGAMGLFMEFARICKE